jgi:hypothetical protein
VKQQVQEEEDPRDHPRKRANSQSDGKDWNAWFEVVIERRNERLTRISAVS